MFAPPNSAFESVLAPGETIADLLNQPGVADILRGHIVPDDVLTTANLSTIAFENIPISTLGPNDIVATASASDENGDAQIVLNGQATVESMLQMAINGIAHGNNKSHPFID